MQKSAPPWQKLHALTVAIDAAAMREPYPRLALLMQSLASQQTELRTFAPRPA
jgi:hypothetical protein